MSGLALQFINLLAALLLLLAFAMLAQRRILSLIHLYTMQGVVLVAATAAMGYVSRQPHLYVSAGLTLALKVFLIPWLLHRVIDRLNVRWDVETLINIPTTLLFGILLVIFSFNLAQPISELSASIARGRSGRASVSPTRANVFESCIAIARASTSSLPTTAMARLERASTSRSLFRPSAREGPDRGR